jgi:RHS repeat-associated protein
MLLASNHMTPVIGVDIHATAAPPFNPVQPFIGLIMDPMDYVPFIGATVYINGIPRAITDTGGMLATKVHIPIASPPFVMAPMIAHEAIGFFGSMNTYIEDRRVCPKGFMVMSCNDVGIPASLQLGPPKKPGKKFSIIPSLFAPTSMSLPIPTGPPVIVGGPYVPDLAGLLMNMAMGLGFGALMKIGKKAGAKLLKTFNHKVCKKFKSTKKLGDWLCKKGFEPMDLVQGIVIYEGEDFTLPGPIPLEWKRSWFSDSGYTGYLGHGCHSNFDLPLYVDFEDDHIGLLLPDGRGIGFPVIKAGEEFFNRTERLTLKNNINYFELKDHKSGLSYVYQKGLYKDFRVHEIRNDLGFKIELKYSGSRLIEITDSCGRILKIKHDNKERIIEIALAGNGQKLVGYSYNEEGDMAGITDALDQMTTIEYRDHLMVKKVDRNGYAFYWEYDGKKIGARCIHTWGDEGLLEGKVEYFPEKGFNIVTNSIGAKTTYFYTPDNIVTEVKDALGNSSFTDYTSYSEVYREIDEEGNMTGYTYDDRGNRTSVVLPDGSQYMYFYNDQDRLILATDPEGNSTMWIYDEQRRLINTNTPDGASTSFEYNEKNLISKITDAGENETLLEYDEQNNLTTMLLPNGSKANWRYNQMGDVVQIENPEGASQSFTYDKLGRPVHIRQADLNNIKLQYNAYDEIIHSKDDSHDIRFSYTPLGRLKVREENGTKVSFIYNTEEQLNKIVNEHGEAYRFQRNKQGDITLEEGFDGITRILKRDMAGKVIRVDRPDNRWTEYEYDATGRTIRAEYSDGTWEIYSYDKRGLLIEARNQNIEVSFKRDPMGRVVEESQGEHKVISRFDKNGNRIRIESSLGAEIDIEFDAMGDVAGMEASCKSGQNADKDKDNRWQAKITRNTLGQEVERILTGGVKSRMWYDYAGRPVGQRVQTGNTIHRHRSYKWNVNYRLWQMVNELTGGITTFTHDDFGNLASARYEDGSYDYKIPDAVGNLYRTPRKTDRKYGKGGRLLETDKYHYDYDAEGNLIKKIGLNNTWEYSWCGNGMLKSVENPGGKIIEFEYDALGRRTAKIITNRSENIVLNPESSDEKSQSGNITRFIWDGNVHLHEWKYKLKDRPKWIIDELSSLSRDKTEPVSDLITWIFDEGTFKPSAKIVHDQQYSTITDYLGTPVEMYNSQGQKEWGVEYDIYGKIRKLVSGALTDCPFRYQGQYEDVETGLYYNRFRYYDPEDGVYVSQDPIQIAGGTNVHEYLHDVNGGVDPFGLSPWDTVGFNEWFNKASVKDIAENKDAVSDALRAPGGKHEMFPVCIASKAKELGFTAEEIKSMSVDTRKITFTGVTDSAGNALAEGAHHGSKAGRHFHNKLIKDLNSASTKQEALDIIKKHHDTHMKLSCQ